MCRFAAYMGPEIFISSLVTEPKHSIIHQSYHSNERDEPLNGDGYGLGWFSPQFSKNPAVFKEVLPAWNSQNLRDITRVTKSPCIFAHIRAATLDGEVSRPNCHPFSWRNFLFMHNGSVFGFEKIQRNLRASLSDEAYNMIKGYTDSEHIFALFADEIKDKANPSAQIIIESLSNAFKKLERLKAKANIQQPSTLNVAISDGQNLVVTRHISRGQNSNSLYLFQGKNFACKEGEFYMEQGEHAVLVASEPLSNSADWQQVPNNHYIIVDQGMQMGVLPITN